jgi:hypothetical protein
MCTSCRTPCEYQNDVAFRTEGNNRCPIGRWMQYQTFVKNLKAIRGAGDLVAKVAEPIAGVIDMMSRGKTKLKGCSACAKRKDMLNQLLPFGAVR